MPDVPTSRFPLFVCLFVALSLISGNCHKAIAGGDPNEWYKDAIIYNLDVRTFKDSDGNGVGDFNGLTSELNYLQSLDIDTIWLEPFQPSPLRDDGYDITDFYGIDPKVGTQEDFAAFMAAAKARHIRVIMDLVINHTSDQHRWFLDAENDGHSPYRDWFVWSKDRPDDWNKGMVFPGVQKETWTRAPEAGEYYYHRFYAFEPNLNSQNPNVREEDLHIISYWLNQGMDGFRVDAVPFLIEIPRTGTKHPDHNFQELVDMRSFLHGQKPDVILLGEANVPPKESKNYFGKNGEAMQMLFNFHVNQELLYALAIKNAEPVEKALSDTQNIPASSEWAMFLRNHDEADLGKLYPWQKQEVYSQFGPDKDMQLYKRGIRRRLAPMLGNDPRRLAMAYSLLFALPATPVIRYGEEIGMGDDLNLTERLSIRTPMQWDEKTNGGFSSAKEIFRPVISQGAFSYKHVNVTDEQRNPHSLLNQIKQLIRLRRQCPEISQIKPVITTASSSSVLSLDYESGHSSLIILHNFSDKPQNVIFKSANRTYADLLNHTKSLQTKDGKLTVALAPYGFIWMRSAIEE